MLTLLFLLLTKHFVIDFLLQPKWMWANKGTFGHPGGVAHALLHAFATLVILLPWFASPMVMLIPVWEFVLHYLIDYGKMNLNAFFGWRPDTSSKFWWLLGLDQWLHNLCYILIFAIIYGG